MKKHPITPATLHEYLDIAHGAIEGKTKKLSDPYRPSPSERKVCLLWAMAMCEKLGPDAPVRENLQTLYIALDQVRNHSAIVDMNNCKVFCSDAGHVIEFND